MKAPPWYRRAVDQHPDLCTDALVTVYRSRIRRRVERNNHLFALSEDPVYAEVARLGVPTLLGVFPTRCTKPQVSALHALLWAGLLYVPKAELAERIRRRSGARGMDTAQRALWLAAGLFISAKEYRPEVVAFVLTGREPRARHILDFLVPDRPVRRDLPEPWDDWEESDIAALFRALGRWYDPWWGARESRYEATTLSLRTDWLLKRWLEILAERAVEAGEEALRSLSRFPALDSWFDEIQEVRGRAECPAPYPVSTQ